MGKWRSEWRHTRKKSHHWPCGWTSVHFPWWISGKDSKDIFENGIFAMRSCCVCCFALFIPKIVIYHFKMGNFFFQWLISHCSLSKTVSISWYYLIWGTEILDNLLFLGNITSEEREIGRLKGLSRPLGAPQQNFHFMSLIFMSLKFIEFQSSGQCWTDIAKFEVLIFNYLTTKVL